MASYCCVLGQNTYALGLSFLTYKDYISYPTAFFSGLNVITSMKVPCKYWYLEVHFLTLFYTVPLFAERIPSSTLIWGSLQRLDCGALNNLQKLIRQLFPDLCVQLYCTKENTFPLSIKSAVCGKIYQGPAVLSDKVRASGFHSSWKVALVCVSLLLVCVCFLFVCFVLFSSLTA